MPGLLFLRRLFFETGVRSKSGSLTSSSVHEGGPRIHSANGSLRGVNPVAQAKDPLAIARGSVRISLVRLAWSFLLFSFACYAAEDLHAIESVMKNGDASLDRFQVLAKKPVDETYSVMVVAAAEKPGPIERPNHVGVFVVSGETNRVRLVLDTDAASGDVAESAMLDQTPGRSLCVHFYSYYGMYRGSVKYIYDLSGARPEVRIRYGMIGLTSSTIANGRLRYTAMSGKRDRHYIVTIEPGTDDSVTWYNIEDAPAPPYVDPKPTTLRGSIVVANVTPPGQQHQDSVIYVGKQAFPVPIPTLEMYRKTLPEKQAPGEIQNDIGPFVLHDDKVWFASTYYDGEGVSGIGAIGTFDIGTHRYEMRHLPEIAPWSGSAILLDGEDLWVGLMRRPEGADIGAGLPGLGPWISRRTRSSGRASSGRSRRRRPAGRRPSTSSSPPPGRRSGARPPAPSPWRTAAPRESRARA